MTIETLHNEMVIAWKAGDKIRKGVISDLIAQIKRAAIDKGCRDNIDEAMVNAELTKAKKITQEMIDTCPVDRVETLQEYKTRMEIVCEFAPRLIDNVEELNAILDKEFTGDRTIKKEVMKFFSQNYKGRVDMKIVNSLV